MSVGGEQTSEQKMNQKRVGEIFRRWQGAEGWVMVLPGGLEGPPTAAGGEGKWREAWEACGATDNSCLT